MWNIVRVSPQGHRSLSVSCHFLLQAPQCPCSVRKRFSRDHCCRGRLKPGCQIVGSHTRWQLTAWANFQLCLHRLLMSTGCKSSHSGFLDVSRSNGGGGISSWIGHLSRLTIFSTSLSVSELHSLCMPKYESILLYAAHSHLCGCCSGHTVRGVSERGPAINQRPHQIQNYVGTKEVRIITGSSCLFQLLPQPLLRTRLRARLGGLVGKAGSYCEEFVDNEDGILGLMFLRVLVPAHPSCPA